jgi:hypothetical protein
MENGYIHIDIENSSDSDFSTVINMYGNEEMIIKMMSTLFASLSKELNIQKVITITLLMMEGVENEKINLQ